MASGVVGALRINMGLDSAEFQAGLANVKRGMQDIGKIMAGVTAGLAAAGAGMAAMVNKMSATAAATGDVADRLGVPVETLQELRHAAEMSGVALKNFDVGFRRFIRRSAEAAKGGGAAKDAFKELGISLTTSAGKMRAADAIFEDVAEAMTKIEDPAHKLRLAFKMFDTDGAAMVKMFENGGQGIRDFRVQAQKLGIVLGEDTIRSSQRFQDSVSLMKKLVEGFTNRIFAGILPAFERFAAMLYNAAANSTVLDGAVKIISATMNGLTAAIGLVLDNLHHLVDLFKVLVVAQTVKYTVALAGSMLSLAKTIRTVGLAATVLTSISRLKITAFLLLGATIAKLTGQFDNLVEWVQRTGQAIHDSLPESLKSGIDSASESLRTLTNDLFATETAASNAFATYLRTADEAAASFGQVGDAAKSAVGSWKTTVTTVQQVGSDMESSLASMKDVGQSLQSSLSGNFRSIIDGSKSMRDIVADIMADVGSMLFSKSLGSLLTGGGGGGGLSFAGLPGFANGGSFQVGGTGGIDSQLVAFRASPTERVTITKPGQEGGGRAPVFNVNIDASGADVAAVARLEGALAQFKREVPRMIVETQLDRIDRGRA